MIKREASFFPYIPCHVDISGQLATRPCERICLPRDLVKSSLVESDCQGLPRERKKGREERREKERGEGGV